MSDIKQDTGVDFNVSHPSMVDRYFVKRYKIGLKNKQGEDLCILEHSNRICIITLAPSHPIISLKKSVVKVDFQADTKTNRLDNKVSGKFKKGAQWINEGSPLCHISCDDGSMYTVYGCIRGSLIEVNTTLITRPQLVNEKPDSDGYIAILLTKITDHEKEMSKLLTSQQYAESRPDGKYIEIKELPMPGESLDVVSNSTEDCKVILDGQLIVDS